MGKIKDLTGQKFGLLTVKEFAGCDENGASWECECDCGASTYAYSKFLKSGQVKSCGCLRSKNMKKVGEAGRQAKLQKMQRIKNSGEIYQYSK